MSGRSIGWRGGEHFATFKIAAALDTSTSIDANVMISSSSTVALCNTCTSYSIGTIVETRGGAAGDPVATVNLNWPTKKGISGAAVTAATQIMFQSATSSRLIDVSGTLTANVVQGISINATAAALERVEYFPLIRSGVVIA